MATSDATTGALSKACTHCNETKPLDEFPRQRSRKDGHAVWCKPCHRAKSREWRLNNPERARETQRRYRQRNPQGHRRPHLRRTYGIELEVYDLLLQRQGGMCAICGRTEGDAAKKVLCVDHVAGTNLIRGLLCAPCNSAIGLLNHDPARLASAIEYLSKLPALQGQVVPHGIHRGPRRARDLPTHCRQGHEYAGDNLRIDPSGTRRCRSCEREGHRKRKLKQKGTSE